MKKRIFDIIQIENKDDFPSKFFDIFLVLTIILNISIMFLQTFDELTRFYPLFSIIEIVTLIIFCIEYGLRIWTADILYPNVSKVKSIIKFMTSFDGIIELLTILPFFFLSGFVAFRILRVIRIFHLFRINAQYDSFNVITTALFEKKGQILSSIVIIFILMMASSLCMYSAEHEAQPEVFRNAFSGIWWSISTILTVGYGDIYPITTIGKLMAIIISFLGVGAVAIPTGIISASFVEQYTKFKTMAEIEYGHNLKFISLDVIKNHSWKDKQIKDLSLPEGILIASIIRDNTPLVPNGSLKLQENDKIILGAKSYNEENLEIKEIFIRKGNENINKKIKDLDISRQTIILSISRKNKTIIPNGETIIKENDILLVYSKSHIDKI